MTAIIGSNEALFSSVTEERTADITTDLKQWANELGKVDQLRLTITFTGEYVSQQGTWASREQKANFIVDVKDGFKIVEAVQTRFFKKSAGGAEHAAQTLVIGKIKVKAHSLDRPLLKTSIYSSHHVTLDTMAQHVAPLINWNS